jgi:hypothetical protein
MSLVTDVENYLKDVFATGYADEATRIHPGLDKISKPDIVAYDYKYLIKISNSQNIAVGDDNLAAAQAVGGSSKSKRLTFDPSIMSGEAILPVTQLELSLRGSTYAFGSLIETEVDGLQDEFYTRRGFQLYRDSFSARGQISNISGNILTVLNALDVVNLVVGMPLNASVNSNGTSPRTGTMNILSVDIDDGTITVDNAGAISGLSVNDYMFLSTEINQLALEGMGLSTPLLAPTAGDSFRGLDRSVDVARLAGSRLTTSSATGTLEQNIIKLIAKIRTVGGKCNFAAMHSDRAQELRTRLGAKVRYMDGGSATYGFNSFMFDAPGGTIEVIDDPDCPSTAAWVGNSGSHELPTLDALVRIDESDGNWAYKKPSNDQIGVRIRSVAQYLQREPRNFGVTPIS